MDSEYHMNDLDLINLIRTMTKEYKMKYFSKFLSEMDNPHYNIKVLCETSGVGNARIDYPHVCIVYCIDLAPYILDINQEMGRAVRQDEASPNDYRYIMCFSIETYIELYYHIWDMFEQILDPGYRFHHIDDLNEVGRMLLR